MPNRLIWIDLLRGYAMGLVVLGHALLGLITAGALAPDQTAATVFLFIYAFHMPAFFFASGYVSHAKRQSFFSALRPLLQWIFFPYILWSVLIVLVQNIFPGSLSPFPLSSLYQILWEPLGVFWFLFVLFFIKLGDWVVSHPRLARLNPHLVLACAAAIGFQSFYSLALTNTLPLLFCGGLFFYALGRIAHNQDLLFTRFVSFFTENRVYLSLAVLSCITILAFAVFYYVRTTLPDRPLVDPRAFYLITGMSGLFMLLLLAHQTHKALQAVSLLGTYSMVIYVQHTLWAAGMRKVLLHSNFTSPLLLIIAITLTGLVLPMLWQKITDRLGLTSYFGIRPIKP